MDKKIIFIIAVIIIIIIITHLHTHIFFSSWLSIQHTHTNTASFLSSCDAGSLLQLGDNDECRTWNTLMQQILVNVSPFFTVSS